MRQPKKEGRPLSPARRARQPRRGMRLVVHKKNIKRTKSLRQSFCQAFSLVPPVDVNVNSDQCVASEGREDHGRATQLRSDGPRRARHRGTVEAWRGTSPAACAVGGKG